MVEFLLCVFKFDKVNNLAQNFLFQEPQEISLAIECSSPDPYFNSASSIYTTSTANKCAVPVWYNNNYSDINCLVT